MPTCPGCGLELPRDESAAYDGYYHTTPECWRLYAEVLAEEYEHAVLFGQCHQLTVDTYAAQHAGGEHPDKSVGIHLAGLYLMLEEDVRPPNVPSYHQRLADAVGTWPSFDPPVFPEETPTVLHVALADSSADHAERSRDWAEAVWEAWAPYHDVVRSLTHAHLDAT